MTEPLARDCRALSVAREETAVVNTCSRPMHQAPASLRLEEGQSILESLSRVVYGATYRFYSEEGGREAEREYLKPDW